MNIASTQYNLESKTFEIYVSGCDGKCGTSCHNYELRDFSIGSNYLQEIDKIIEKINKSSDMIDNIWILGGEPLLQNRKELLDMVLSLKNTNKKLWLFTRFEIENVKNIFSEYQLFDYIKCGEYDKSKTCTTNIQYGIKLATSNQYIIENQRD